MKTTVWITTQFEGFHRWPQAPEEVHFLRNLHRHIFGVKVGVSVSHHDRDVEFFILKGIVNGIIKNMLLPFMAQDSSYSCERIAKLIMDQLHYAGFRVRFVEVDEDGENGARLEHEV